MTQNKSRKRVRINRPFPTHSLEDVLPIARTIQDVNSGLPMSRELLATALGTTPSSSGFRMKLTSSAKYGLTLGGYSDENISLTALGQQCVAPQGPDEARISLKTAASEPEIFRDFYRLLDGKRMPEELYARNMLVRELTVHPDLAAECLGTIITNGLFTGILRNDGQNLIVSFDDGSPAIDPPTSTEPNSQRTSALEVRRRDTEPSDRIEFSIPRIFMGFFERSDAVNRIIDFLGELRLTIVPGDLSADSQSLSLPADVTRAMQDCDAGIVIAPGIASDADAPDAARERAIWIFLGAATFQFGEKVVLVETSAGGSSGPTPGIRTVAAGPENLEATALGILTELIDVGAIKIMA